MSCAGRGEVISSDEAPLDSIPPPTHVRNYDLDGMWPLTPSGSVNYVYIVITGKCLTGYVTVTSLPAQTAEPIA